MKLSYYVILISLAFAGLGCPSNQPTVERYILIKTTPVSTGVADYEFSLILKSNTGIKIPGYIGVVTSTNTATTTILEREILVGEIFPGATRGTPDTFTMRAPTTIAASFKIDWTTLGATARYARASIGITGGTVATNDNTIGATFEGNFSRVSNAEVYVTNQPSDRKIFSETADLYGAGTPDPRELRVKISELPPGENVLVWFTPLNATSKVLWIRIPQKNENGKIDSYIPVVPTIQYGGKLQGSIPPSAFKDTTDGQYEIVVIAAEPQALIFSPQIAQVSSADETMVCPLVIGCNTIGNFDFARLAIINGIRNNPSLGIDFSAPANSQVIAIAAGIVKSAYFNESLGNTVIIVHLNGMVSRYSHLAEILVNPGYNVAKEEVIGLSGSTGLSLQPHLRLEMTKIIDGQPYPLNPINILDMRKTVKFSFARNDGYIGGENEFVELTLNTILGNYLIGTWNAATGFGTITTKMTSGTWTITIRGISFGLDSIIPYFLINLDHTGTFSLSGWEYQFFNLTTANPTIQTQITVP